MCACSDTAPSQFPAQPNNAYEGLLTYGLLPPGISLLSLSRNEWLRKEAAFWFYIFLTINIIAKVVSGGNFLLKKLDIWR